MPEHFHRVNNDFFFFENIFSTFLRKILRDVSFGALPRLTRFPRVHRLWKTGSADDLLYAPHDSIVEHHLDSVRMRRRLRENSLNDPFGQRSGSLVLLFDDAHFHSWLDARSVLAIHELLVRHCVDNEVDTELESFGGGFQRVLRLVDPFPEVSDIVVEADDDGQVAL